MFSLMSASHICSAWASVFTAMNSTPLQAGVDHAVDGVRAAAADADDLDDCQVAAGLHAMNLVSCVGFRPCVSDIECFAPSGDHREAGL